MKTMTLLLMVLSVLLQIVSAQMTGQPHYVGLTPLSKNSYYGPYATLFEPTGRFFLTTRHWTFNQKPNGTYDHTLMFGNGQMRKVKNIHYFSSSDTAYDLAIGELETPMISVVIPEVWWQMPQDLKQDEIEITGWNCLNGWFTGTEGHIYFNHPVEVNKALAYKQPSIQGGYSGSPVFYKGRIVGLSTGAYPFNPPHQGGWVTLLSLVFQDYWSFFPSALVSLAPTKVETLTSISGSVFEIVLHTPPGTRHQITATEDFSQWIPVYQKAGFIESVPISQWETKVRWNMAGIPRTLFRAERQ